MEAPAPVSFSPLGLTQHVTAVCGKMLLIWLVVGLAALDAEHLWLPSFLIYPGILFGLVCSISNEGLLLLGLRIFTGRLGFLLLNRLIAVLAAAGLILLIRGIYWLIRRREGIGLGDAKLMAMLAAWLGLQGALLAFAIGVVLGAGIGLVLLATPKFRQKGDAWAITKLPLGTFLCIGGIISALCGQPILAAYLRWSGIS
jgi:leader peptidase (prepilin peptidase)/N-methyltransferase